MIWGLDPGPKQSALVGIGLSREVRFHQVWDNDDMAWYVAHCIPSEAVLAYEMVRTYGMAVGEPVFDTVFHLGRIVQAHGGPSLRLYNTDVRLYLCKNVRASQSNIRQAIIDLYGGLKEIAIGTKKKPGPLYGIKSHEWSALGIALTAVPRIYPEHPDVPQASSTSLRPHISGEGSTDLSGDAPRGAPGTTAEGS